jgi:small GTP-binding protein
VPVEFLRINHIVLIEEKRFIQCFISQNPLVMDLISSQESPDIKVVIVGDTSVGKTSILSQFQYGSFNPSVESTIGTMFVAKQVDTSHGKVNLLIWDTAGQERYRSLIPMYTRNANAALIIVDVSLPSSYDSIDTWYDMLKETCQASVKVYIAANKIDLEVQIPLDDLKEWADARGCDLFKSCAARPDTVAPIFMKMAEDLGRTPKLVVTPREAVEDDEPKRCC